MWDMVRLKSLFFLFPMRSTGYGNTVEKRGKKFLLIVLERGE